MAAFDRWHDGDFASLARDYLARLLRERGVRRAIEPNGDLRIERLGTPASHLDLRSALETPSWFDPATGGPRP